MRGPFFLLCLLSLLFIPLPSPAEAIPPAAAGEDAARIQPLLPGQAIPDAPLQTADGTSLSLQEVLAGKPALLIFYRGGWCPFCTKQLASLKEILPELQKLDIPLLAVSPDKPEKLREYEDKDTPGFRLLSDRRMNLARACGIAFRVDDATREKYKGYKIDLQAASGEDHFQLPVPTVFLIGADGKILFSYSHPDYKVRLHPDVILAAVKTMLPEPVTD